MSGSQGGSPQEDLQIVRLFLLIHMKIIHLFVYLYEGNLFIYI